MKTDATLINGYERQEGFLELNQNSLDFFKKKSAMGAAAMFGLLGYLFAKKKELVFSIPRNQIQDVEPDKEGNPGLLFVQAGDRWHQFEVPGFGAWQQALSDTTPTA